MLPQPRRGGRRDRLPGIDISPDSRRGARERQRRGTRPVDAEPSNVNDVSHISYVAGAAGAVSAIGAVRWSRYRLDIRDKPLSRGLATAAAVLVGCAAYYLIGFALSLAQPAHQAELLGELRRDFAFATKVIMAAAIAAATCYYYRSRRQATPIDPSEGVRERLLRARADIQNRIEGLQASPVLNYRGGIPQPDLIIEGLRDKLSEIDDALSRLAPTE